jgi:hypothetical protein
MLLHRRWYEKGENGTVLVGVQEKPDTNNGERWISFNLETK